jgi:ribonuclease HII
MVATSPTLKREPTLKLERRAWRAGELVVCGMDEVGRGAWAGPVTMAAVVPGPRHLAGVRDSKQLSREQRERVIGDIERWATAIGVGHATHDECDAMGMTAALRTAGRRAIAMLCEQGFEPDRIILDGNHDFLGLGAKVTTVIKGDNTSLAVAAASIVAKVTRDRMMVEESVNYPGFDFDSNVGYPAPNHKYALAAYGPTSIHRRSWVFMEHLCWRGLPAPAGRLFA